MTSPNAATRELAIVLMKRVCLVAASGTLADVGASDLQPGLPYETKSYVCVEVFDGSKPVLYVTRPDGSWCLLCGGDHPDDASEYRVVGLGHLVENDLSLHDVLDLEPDQEAERLSLGSPWARSRS